MILLKFSNQSKFVIHQVCSLQEKLKNLCALSKKNQKEHYRNTYESYLQPQILKNRSLLLCNLSNLVGFSAITFNLLEELATNNRNLFFVKIAWI